MMFSDKPINLELKEAFYNNLLGIVTIAKAHGIDVVLMTQPGKFSEEKIAIFCGHKPYNDIVRYPRQDEFQKHFQEYNDIIRKVAKEEAVHLIDMNRLFGQESDLYKDMVHYSQEGVKRFGKIYADQLEVILRKTGKAENTEY